MERPSVFVRATDSISYWMGHPANIALWALVLGAWIGLFAFHVLGPSSSILPAWFTSNAFNFPLNTLTTVMELFIGFLVGAAANRAERALTNRSERDFALTRAFEDKAEALLERIEGAGRQADDTLLRVETIMHELRLAQRAILEEEADT